MEYDIVSIEERAAGSGTYFRVSVAVEEHPDTVVVNVTQPQLDNGLGKVVARAVQRERAEPEESRITVGDARLVDADGTVVYAWRNR